MDGKAIGEKPQVKLRLNTLIMEYKKMGLIRKKIDDQMVKVKDNMSLSEKIMKGVIDNLLLKSLNDSKDEVRIQTLQSLNMISPDFIHFLVSSRFFIYDLTCR